MGTGRNRLRLLATIIGFGLSAYTAKAQNTADIVGTVRDSSDAVVAGAAVTIKNVDTNVSRSTAASGTGDYSFTLLPVGTYSVTVEAKGFKRYAVASVTVAAGDVKRVDARMEVGSVAQSETVVATDVAVLLTDSATVGGLLTSTAVQDLPTNGRNVITLVQMAPGANEGTQSSLGGGTRPDDRRQTSTVPANGQNDSTNNFLLDGMDNNERSIATTIVKPSIDSLEEVKVDTNLFDADTGRVGGAVISMVTKSGSNNIHGTLFEFLRNDKLDAKDVFNVPQEGNPLGVRPRNNV
jgi:Carboxypeptidase regulatory-like domain